MRPLLLLLAAASIWAQNPTESRAALNQGVQAFQNARYAESIQFFQEAVDLDPSFATARLYLATAYMQQFIPGNDSPENNQMATRAQDAFLKVLDLDPGNTVATASIASLYLNQKRWSDAREWYQRLIAANPTNADAYYSLGFIAWSEWYPAYQQARTKLGMRPETPGPISDSAVRHDLSARFSATLEDGLADLRKTLELNPQYEDAMSYMNLLVRERADLLDTQAEYQRDTAEADQWVQKAIETKRQKAQQRRAGGAVK
jgi:tetratricopeptide (TPR) repeat protein